MKNDFLPEGYQMRDSDSKYAELEEGTNTFRVLSSAIVGWEWWEEDKEGKRLPRRVRKLEEIPSDVMHRADKRERPREFWAFVVFNYKTEAIQILELKQATIMRAITALVHNDRWGSPKDYDLQINKTVTGSNAYDVEYGLMPNPKEPMDKGILKTYEDLAIDLTALYRGEDPFAPGTKETEQDGEALAEDAAAAIG